MFKIHLLKTKYTKHQISNIRVRQEQKGQTVEVASHHATHQKETSTGTENRVHDTPIPLINLKDWMGSAKPRLSGKFIPQAHPLIPGR